MTVEIAGPALAVALVAVFSASAFAKLAYWDDAKEWFHELFPRLSPPVVAGAATAAEVIIATGVWAAPPAGGAAAALWLVGASAVLWASRKRVADCGCFGRRRRLGPGVAARNAAAFALAVATAAMADTGWLPMDELALVGVVAGVAVVLTREAADRRAVMG